MEAQGLKKNLKEKGKGQMKSKENFKTGTEPIGQLGVPNGEAWASEARKRIKEEIKRENGNLKDDFALEGS